MLQEPATPDEEKFLYGLKLSIGLLGKNAPVPLTPLAPITGVVVIEEKKNGNGKAHEE